MSDMISVIMPCYNAAQYLREGAASALGQTYQNVELIVVDDGSTDGSVAILADIAAKDPRLRYFTQKNKGPGPARNRGLQEARGEYIAFLDADDYWAPDCLEKLHAAIIRESVDLVYCGWQNIGLPSARSEPFIPPDYNEQNKVEAVVQACRWPIHGVLTRKSVIDAEGGFNERWTTSMDFDLWMRIAVFQRIALVPEVLAFYRHHPGPRVTANRARLILNHWNIQRAFLSKHPEIVKQLGRDRIRRITHGELLHKGYEAYWRRDLKAARSVFRQVMKAGYGQLRDWKYMLPSFLPLSWHQRLVRFADHKSEKN